MFKTKNAYLLHRKAVGLVHKHLIGSEDMNDIYGYQTPYHVKWKNIKLLVKLAKRSKKAGQNRKKWYYTLKIKDRNSADYFILLTIAENAIRAIFVLPKLLAPKKTITITQINGNIRYDMFKTDLEHLPEKILEIEKRLPKLIKIFKEAKSLSGGY